MINLESGEAHYFDDYPECPGVSQGQEGKVVHHHTWDQVDKGP